MRQGLLGFAVALVGTVAAPGAIAQYATSGGYGVQTLRCESVDGRERHCPADTRGGVSMSRQLSRTGCIEGQTWGADRDGIWVTQGCRAEFVIGRGGSQYGSDYGSQYDNGGASGRVVRCESVSGRSNLCVMDTRRGVELVRQLSRSSCMREQNWGWNDQGVWVSGGCRAEFRSGRGGGGGWNQGQPPQATQSLRCESADGRERRCPVDTRGGVRLVRQLSRTACIEGRNWGYDRGGVWVDDGCRADFIAGERPQQRWGGR